VNSTVPATERRSLRHLPALDGLRAIAVLSVVAYHADVRALRGGFLGVDVFFVVSGFLITALLLREVSQSGRVDLRCFWARRLRRLVPALATFLIVCAIFWYLFHRAELLRIRAQFAAAAGYVSNWYLVATNGSYFAHLGRPSPLLHLWSLAVEEQFYLVWPLLIGLLVRTRIMHYRKTLAALFVALGLASSTLMALLYRRAQSLRAHSDPSRVYFGTDTRLTGLAIGAALAAVVHAKLGRDSVEVPGHTWAMSAWYTWRSRMVEGGGIAAAIGVGISFVAISDNEPLLYRGGFFVFSALAALLIAAAIAPTSRFVGPALSWRPLRVIGTRAYGIYLWHWPVVVVTRPGVDVHFSSRAVLAIRVIAPLLLAELSYRVIEVPLRYKSGGLLTRPGFLTQMRQGLTAAVVVAIAGLTAFLVVSVGESASPFSGSNGDGVGVEESIRAGQSFLSAQNSAAVSVPDTTSAASTVPPVSSSSSASVGSTSIASIASVASVSETTLATGTMLPPAARKGIPVLVFGDSVMVGASPAIAKALGRNVRIEAEVGRQLVDSPALLRKSIEENFPEILIVNLGNNGPGDVDSMQKILQISSAVPLVIVSTVKVPKPWEAGVNRQIFAEVSSHPNVVIYDWNTIATRNRSLLYSDNIHLNRVGAAEFVQGVSSIIGRYCFADAARPANASTTKSDSSTPPFERCIREPVPGFTPETSTIVPPVTVAVTVVGTVAGASSPKAAGAVLPTKPTKPTKPPSSTSAPNTPTVSTTPAAPTTSIASAGEVVATAPPTTRRGKPATAPTTTASTAPSPTTALPPTTAATAAITATTATPTPTPSPSTIVGTAPPQPTVPTEPTPTAITQAEDPSTSAAATASTAP
jgi:peptidoglycan/LPS O-acetylase OafA/YrhL